MKEHPVGIQKSLIRKIFSLRLLLPFIILACLLAACGNNGTTKKGPTVLKVVSAPSQGNPDNFNPFYNTNGGGAYGSEGFLYETLVFINSYTGQATDWLASSHEFNSDLTQLTFHIRSGVKWSDGKDFTSDDVVFTFNLMKSNDTLDGQRGSPWKNNLLKSVSAPDKNTVIMTLQHPDVTALWWLGTQVYIVPEHVWTTVSDPVKYANDDPVVTGPYTLSKHSAQLIKYVKNPNYWGTKTKVDEIDVPAVATNAAAELMIAQGQLDWLGAGWNPNLDSSFTKKDSQHNHHWFAPSNTFMLYLNTQKHPFDLLNVRKAISLAINRENFVTVSNPYAPVANPAAVLLPTFKDYLSPEYTDAKFQVDTAQAESLLQSAGFTKGGDGIYADKDGHKLSLALTVVNGWDDWVSDTQFIQTDLKKIGIDAQINTVGGYTPYFSALQSGDYDAAISWTNGGPTPYYPFYDMLSGAKSAPAGQPISGTNFERWNDPATDALLKQYATSNDLTTQKQAIQGLEKIMVEQLPAIPLANNPYWNEYTTVHFTGWPDEQNPTDVGAPYVFPDNANIVLHLQPVA